MPFPTVTPSWKLAPRPRSKHEKRTDAWETWTVAAADGVRCTRVGWEINFLLTFETAPFFCVYPIYIIYCIYSEWNLKKKFSYHDLRTSFCRTVQWRWQLCAKQTLFQSLPERPVNKMSCISWWYFGGFLGRVKVVSFEVLDEIFASKFIHPKDGSSTFLLNTRKDI